MPFRARLTEFLTVNKKKDRSGETSRSKSGTTTPQIVEEAHTPIEIEEPLETEPPVEIMPTKEEDAKEPVPSIHEPEDSYDIALDRRLMTIDVTMDIASILKEASEASSAAREGLVNDINRKSLVTLLEHHHRFAESERKEIEGRGKCCSEDSTLTDALEAYLKTLDSARAEVAAWKELKKPLASLPLGARRVATVREIESDLNKAFTDFIRQVHTSILQSTIKTSDGVTKLRVLRTMKDAINARGERVKPLTPGTRISIINRLSDWGDLKDSPEQIFWLHDKAGTGKSAVAAHMAQKWSKEGVLAGRFFFDKNGGREYRTLRRLSITLAKEMSDAHPFANACFLEMFKEWNKDYKQSFTEEFTDLVIEVAEKLSARIPKALIFVIDALDECDEDEVQTLMSSILNTLPKAQGIRFLLTSRPTKEITATLDGLDMVAGKGVVLLDAKNGDTQRDHDTTIYVRHTLRDFSAADQNVVIECASGVFLWATLACDTLLRTVTPKRVLSRFENNTPDKTMETLYETALEAALPPESSPRDLNLLHTVLQGVGLTYAPVSIFAIRSFFPKHEKKTVAGEEFVEYYVKKLGSLMKDGTPYLPIYILHPTFREFIEDQKSGARFYISPPDGHHSIALASLALLQKGLTPNVLNLDDGKSPVPLRTMPDWEPPARLSLDREAPLRYAVAFWATHASLAIGEDEELQKLATEFLRTNLIVWVEWCSAIRELSESIEGLRRLRWAVRIQNPSEVNSLMDRWCTDALHFLLRYSYPIERCGLQAWTSALVFTPKQSLVYQAFSERSIKPLPKLITDYAGTSDCSRVLWDSKQTFSFVNFSPDSKRIIAHGTAPSSLRLWSAKHLNLITELRRGHTNWVYVAAFSSEGSMLASGGEDTRVCLWDGFTGILKERFGIRHQGAILHVAFVLSDTVIVSIDDKREIICTDVVSTAYWPWDRFHEMEGPMHTGQVRNIALSPDRKLFATFSADKSTIIWDPETYKAVGNPMVGTDKVFTGRFSVDGTKIITGHRDGVVAIWDVATQNLLHSLKSGSGVEGIAVDPNGRFVASGGNHLYLWDIETGKSVCPPIEGHVSCLTFNDTGSRLISGSAKSHITVWDVRMSGAEIRLEGTTLRGHTARVNDISSSASGTLIASASQDGTLRVWDTDLLDTSQIQESSQRAHSEVKCLAVSKDGTRLLSAGEEGKFQLWDFITGRKLGNPFKSPEGPALRVVFSSTNAMWASSHIKDSAGIACVWRHRGEEIEADLFLLRCGESSITWMTFGSNKYLATGCFDRSLRVWDVSLQCCIASFECGGYPWHIDISFDGKYLAASFHKAPVRVWSIQSQELVGEMEPFDDNHKDVKYIEFSPDGRSLITQRGNVLRLLNVEDGLRSYAVLRETREGSQIPVHSQPAFSTNGHYLFYWNYVFDLAKVQSQKDAGSRRLEAEKGPGLPRSPKSPLYVERHYGQVGSERWKTPLLLLPADVKATKWVAHGSTAAFGTGDGRVFIIKVPDEYM